MGKVDGVKVFDFVGGPKDGESIRLCDPPVKFFRTAIPEWCTYEFNEKEEKYFYKDSEPIPNEDKSDWFSTIVK